MRIINTEDILVELLKINGTLDGELVVEGTPSAVEFSVKFSISDFGYFGEEIAIEGQTEITDWLIVDSALGVITPTAVVELDEGQYDFTIPSTPADTLSVSYVGVPANATDQIFASNTVVVTTP